MNRSIPLFALVLAACQPPDTDHNASVSTGTEKKEGAHDAAEPDRRAEANSALPAPPAPRPGATASTRTLAEWRKADNRATCAPIALTDDGGAVAGVRRASFAGGWAVAFDQPQARSQYGVAGTGVAVADTEAEVAKVRAQWPLSRDLGGKAGGLPDGAFAGYGVEGASAYPADNPDGRGLNSLAYVVIPGQGCLYNVWSHLGRRHLETLLDGLTLLPTR